MATEVKIPALGESVTSGIIARWHVKDGEQVEKGQLLYELETDKITSEGQADVSGKISLQAEEGEEVEIGAIVATIDETAKGTQGNDDKDDAERESSKTTPSSQEPADTETDDSNKKESSSPEANTSDAETKEHRHSPAVKRLAEETGIDPQAIQGSGKDGRVTKGDMLAAAKDAADKDTVRSDADPAPAQTASSEKRESRRKLSPLRRKIAERLVAAQQEAAILTTFNEVDMSAVMQLRKRHQDRFVEKHGVKLGFMSFFLKAVVHALKSVPAINARIEGDELVEQHYYDIGVAVGTDRGLLVPIVRGCDEKSFAAIEQTILDYAGKARQGKIQIDDLQGGVFTISNGGIYGSMLSTPILNPPQSGILGLHNITERAVVVDGEIVVRPMMYLALSYDHRIVDGKEAVTFLSHVKAAIEEPSRLLFEI